MTKDDVTIEVRDVTKAFRVYSDKSHTFKDRVLFRKRNAHAMHKVLNHISFDVKRGQALGLIGHNGCGKSTTLKLLNRILYPDSGQILMHGKISSLIELGAGFHPDMTGRENIYINASIFGLKRHEIEQRLEQIIRFSELEEYIDNPVRTYSSGMYMRLAFAIAINVDADILLVDEILAVGDANFQKKCFAKLSQLKQEGKTIVIVSHDLGQIQKICDRVIWIDGGQINKDGSARDVIMTYLVEMEDRERKRKREEERSYLGKVEIDANVRYRPTSIANQADETSRNTGDMRVRYCHLLLSDKNGNQSQTFRSGDDLLLKYKITADFPASINLCFDIYNQDGKLCCSTSSLLYYGKYLRIDSYLEGEVLLENLSLVTGRYNIDAIIRNEDGTVHNYMVRIIKIQMYSDPSDGNGVVPVHSRWNTAFEKEKT